MYPLYHHPARTETGAVRNTVFQGGSDDMGEIHDAASSGDAAKVKALLTVDPSLISSRDEKGLTPLHVAALRGHRDVTELLLANAAIVDAEADGMTPLHAAAGGGRYGRCGIAARQQR
jgi:ankyrin repeat protein